MSDNVPWVARVFERDRKIERFQAALETIANREPDVNAMTPDQALAALQEVVRIARNTLEQFVSVPKQR
jgi:hypothetical protein